MTYNIHCTRNFNFNNIFSSNNFYLNKKFENYAQHSVQQALLS